MTKGEEADINLMPRYTIDDSEKENKRKTSKKEKPDVTVNDFLNYIDENEDSEKNKKTKG